MASTVNTPEKTNNEGQDVNCRLRHGLNVYCLAHIFQYLDTPDLNTLGKMNRAYKHIIKDLVIPKHEVNLSNLAERKEILEIFQKYGKKIQKIYFKDSNKENSVHDLVKSIELHCPADQHTLKSVQIYCSADRVYKGIVRLPSHFEKVEKFVFHGSSRLLSVQLTESLSYLHLEETKLRSKFDWSKLENLKELHLKLVFGINVKKFIEFLRQNRNLEVFHHDQFAFGKATQDVCGAMAEYCGNQLQDYSGIMPPEQNVHNFISGFKALKKVCLTTYHSCGGDLVDAIKRLAENNTIEMLHIKYSPVNIRETTDCVFMDRSNRDRFDMGHFSHLKTVKIGGYVEFEAIKQLLRIETCGAFNLFSAYSSQILSNVENLAAPSCWNYIEYAPKLQNLTLYAHSGYYDRTDEMVVYLLSVLCSRNDGLDTKYYCIHVKYDYSFAVINGHSDPIQSFYILERNNTFKIVMDSSEAKLR